MFDEDMSVFFDDFSINAVFHLPNGNRTIKSIFNADHYIAKKNGARIENASPFLLIPRVDLEDIERRTEVSINDVRYQVVSIEPGDSGISKVFLGGIDEQSTAKSDIRY